ncbi:MAG: hypothetical protein AAFV90_13845 [Cyanobacteria bacterium J06634_5]
MPLLNRSVFYLSASFSTFLSIAVVSLVTPCAIAQATFEPIALDNSTQHLSDSESVPNTQSPTPVQRQLLEAAVDAAEKVKQEELLSGNLVKIANAYARLGDTAGSRALLERADLLAAGNSFDMVHVAEGYIAIGDIVKADELLQAAIAAVDQTVSNNRLPHSSSSALATIVDAYAILPDDDKRSQGLSQISASKLDPFEPSSTNSYLLRRIAFAYGQMENTEQAIEGLNYISRIALDHIELIQSGQIAENVIRRATDSDLNDPAQVNTLIDASLTSYASLLTNLSADYRQQGDFETAKERVDLALEINKPVSNRYLTYGDRMSLSLQRLLNLAQEYAQFDELAVSNQLLTEARGIAKEDENPYSWIDAHGFVAAAYYEINELAQAQVVLAEANDYAQVLLEEADSLERERLAYMVIDNLAEAYEKVGDVSNQQRVAFQSIDGMISIIERMESGNGLTSEMSQAERDSFKRHTLRLLLQRYSDVALADENSDRLIQLEHIAKSSLLADRRIESLRHLTVAAARQGDSETADRLAQDLFQAFVAQSRPDRSLNVRGPVGAFSMLSDSESAFSMLQTIHQQLDETPIESVANLSYQDLVRAYLNVLSGSAGGRV